MRSASVNGQCAGKVVAKPLCQWRRVFWQLRQVRSFSEPARNRMDLRHDSLKATLPTYPPDRRLKSVFEHFLTP
jgi:hypothetical protein